LNRQCSVVHSPVGMDRLFRHNEAVAQHLADPITA
jgi:hypothetical protein